MLLDFKVTNWMSFKETADLSLVATAERQHASTLAKVPRFRSKKVLPIASIYGGNASGKTNIIRALSCLKNMVTLPVGVDALIPVQPFLLDKESAAAPTSFDITFMSADIVYRFVVEATAQEITYECLERLNGNGSVVDIYERDITANDGEPFVFNKKFFSDNEMVKFVYKGTRVNQMFLNNAIQQNISELSPIYHWFNSALKIIGVESEAMDFALCCAERNGFIEYASRMLASLDTGIVDLVPEPVDPNIIPKIGTLNQDIEQLGEGNLLVAVGHRPDDYGFDMLIARRSYGELKVDHMCTVHKCSDGTVKRFELYQESSGTKQLMQLLPMLFDFEQNGSEISEHVYVVDELDRCLHTMLTSHLIENYLQTCGATTRKQLIFTTHDLLLMDQRLMRRDEMYITQRNTKGASELIGLADFIGIRFDKDLIKSYLEGRFGGVPMFTGTGA